MKLMSFKDWLQRESSAFTRARSAAARGLAVATPNLISHSRSTIPPGELEGLLKHTKGDKKKKKKKDGKKDKDQD